MKKLLCVVPALLVFAMIGAPNAHADSYTPTFTCAGFTDNCYGQGPATAPNVTFPGPTNLDLTYDSDTFNLTLPVVDAATDAYRWGIDGLISENGFSDQVVISDLTTGQIVDATFDNYGHFITNVGGALTFSPANAATPEPAPAMLMLLGIGLIFLLVRKRLVIRLPQAA